MSKTEISSGFAKFAPKTTKGGFKEAQTAERMMRGVPFDVGDEGTAVVSRVIFNETRPDKQKVTFPRMSVELLVETPESGRGQKLSGPGLQWTLKDSDNSDWTAQQAYTAGLSMFEQLGCPEEVTQGDADGIELFNDIGEWFAEEPRIVTWIVEDNSYTGRNGKQVAGKQVRAYALLEAEDEDALTAEGDDDDGTRTEGDKTIRFCTYRGAKHQIVTEKDETLDLLSPGGRLRQNVDKDQVDML